MKRSEKIKLLQEIKSGQSKLIKQLQVERFIKTLTDEELHFICDNEEFWQTDFHSLEELREKLKFKICKQD